jgi:hypothetical protein
MAIAFAVGLPLGAALPSGVALARCGGVIVAVNTLMAPQPAVAGLLARTEGRGCAS